VEPNFLTDARFSLRRCLSVFCLHHSSTDGRMSTTLAATTDEEQDEGRWGRDQNQR
jgi:hypothetical protein